MPTVDFGAEELDMLLDDVDGIATSDVKSYSAIKKLLREATLVESVYVEVWCQNCDEPLEDGDGYVTAFDHFYHADCLKDAPFDHEVREWEYTLRGEKVEVGSDD